MKKTKFALSALVIFSIFNFSVYSQTFTKITQGPFVNDGGASRSVNFVDYDGDGDLDLFVSNGKRFGQYNFIYNNSGGIYNRVLNAAPVLDSLPHDGSSWADFDNDGDLDVCTVTWYDSLNTLFRNDGGGAFTFLNTSPVVTNRGFSETCSWGDYDNDGLVDLFVTNSEGIGTWKNWLYKNTGSGNFTRIDTGAISSDINQGSRGVNWIDIDGDRDLDIFVSNELGQNELIYKNEGNGYFTKVLGIPPVSAAGDSWSSSWGDYDNDGDFDLFVTNWGNQKNKLFKNDGNFNFTQITNDTIVNENGYFACSGWGDYDNDGDLDMFVTQAYRTPNAPLKNMLFKNKLIETSTASFEKITTGDIVNDQGYSYGFSWGDFDADGDLDMFIAKTYSENENNACYRNDGNSNKWIEIKCIGTNTNHSAIGSKVRIKTLINSNPVWQMREVDAQSGYCGQVLDLHFGLGNASLVDSIKVEWPSGTTQHFTSIPVNQIITIDETAGIIGIKKLGEIIPQDFKLYQNYPNPFNPSTKIRFNVPAGITDMVFLKIYDITGKEINTLVNKYLKPGIYETEFKAINFSSGVYYCKLETKKFVQTKKMILLK